MPLYGCGFNAHCQVTDIVRDDVTSFQLINSSYDIRFLFTGWSETSYCDHERCLVRAGVVAYTQPELIRFLLNSKRLVNGFGDSSYGLRGAIDIDGDLHIAHRDTSLIVAEKAAATPQISLVALAGNGSTVVAYDSLEENQATILLQFGSVNDFFNWYMNSIPEASNRFVLRGSAQQLVANEAGFTLLMASGEVYTWGDYRYPACTGRSVSAESPADIPALVDDLGGIKVNKVASGGWMTMAITAFAEGFMWGISEPGNNEKVGLGAELDKKQGIVSIELPQQGNDFEEHDIADVAVGDGHSLVLDGKGQVWSTGKNDHGQLGIGKLSPVEANWCKVDSLQELGNKRRQVIAVVCGALTSFAVVKKIT